MNKEEFLRQLEQLLSGISEEERADAIAFYRSYFEDAGEENEAAILEELVSPQKVAESIMKNLGADGGGGSDTIPTACNTEYGRNEYAGNEYGRNEYAGNQYGRNKYAGNEYGRNEYAGDQYGRNEYAGNEYGRNEYTGNGASNQEQKKDHTATIVLAVVVAVLASPIWLTLLVALVGVLIAVVAILFGLAVAVVAVMGALIFTGFVLMGVGIASLFGGAPAVGVGLMGGGLIVLALGILAVLLVVWVFGAFLPWAFKGIANLCRKPFDKRKERAAV